MRPNVFKTAVNLTPPRKKLGCARAFSGARREMIGRPSGSQRQNHIKKGRARTLPFLCLRSIKKLRTAVLKYKRVECLMSYA